MTSFDRLNYGYDFLKQLKKEKRKGNTRPYFDTFNPDAATKCLLKRRVVVFPGGFDRSFQLEAMETWREFDVREVVLFVLGDSSSSILLALHRSDLDSASSAIANRDFPESFPSSRYANSLALRAFVELLSRCSLESAVRIRIRACLTVNFSHDGQ
ncbi:hypothetical protein EUGRSUZ_H02503 [Eucalyptus grandis]|uniref:Uncharacterized protein n=2 Tax=Eucalyptus grandis TaxID=71139 RepID=A0ACC3JS51_EUCGR|nr:hypothetical protein EUGRSUZ_H02503 [Eucalyptus grandis]